MRTIPCSLVLITIDCLRADHVGFLGYSGQTTPFLDSLAEESFVFHSAIASGVPTYYSLPALFASRYPLALGRDIIGIAPSENTLAGELKECGYKTAAFIAANPYISRAYGYDRGFDTFVNFLDTDIAHLAFKADHESTSSIRSRANRMLSKACHNLPLLGEAYDEVYFQYCRKVAGSACESLDDLRKFPSAEELVDCATAWLDEHSSEPFFLWIHLMDPHAPYYPKPQAVRELGYCELDAARAKYLNSYWNRSSIGLDRLRRKRKSILNLYDAGIRWADLQIQRLAQRLRELSVWGQCAIAVTADHGEEFLENGRRFHAPLALNEELVHIPLLLRVPGHLQRRDVGTPIGLIDLTPTLLNALEMSVPASFHGRSCWQQLTSWESWDWPVITECVHGCNNPFQADKRSGPRLMAVRQRDYKLVINFISGTEELFDLQSDPNESNAIPLGAAVEDRRYLLQCARKHLEQASKCKDIDLRLAAQIRDLGMRWEQSAVSRLN